MVTKDVVKSISKNCGLKKSYVKEIVKAVFDDISKAISEYWEVTIRWFGKFYIGKNKEKVCGHPRDSKKRVTIPAMNVVRFRPSKILKSLVK